jgi:hypothetical protein
LEFYGPKLLEEKKFTKNAGSIYILLKFLCTHDTTAAGTHKQREQREERRPERGEERESTKKKKRREHHLCAVLHYCPRVHYIIPV